MRISVVAGSADTHAFHELSSSPSQSSLQCALDGYVRFQAETQTRIYGEETILATKEFITFVYYDRVTPVQLLYP